MNWLNYLLQVNLYLILFYGFYRLFLHTETFFNLNRGYLLASAALAFFVPLIQSEWVRSWFVTEQISQTFYTLYDPQVFYIPTNDLPKGNLTLGDILACVYIIGVLIGVAKLSGNLIYLSNMMKRKVNHEDPKRAFSFFGMLFVSKSLTNRTTIMKHEFVHIRQLHSADVMLFELIAIFNWFNPMVYLYKSSIKHIHEFIADEIASRHEVSKAAYAMLLFQEQFGVQAIPLTNNFFNQSLIKLRIRMLQKQRSTQRALLKYGLTAPLFMVMIVVSSATLASKSLAKIESNLSAVSQQPLELVKLPEVAIKPATQVLAESGIDVSQALIISPALAKELQADSNIVYNAVQQQAQYPGGMQAFANYLQQHLKYPAEAQKAKASGKVYIQFIVNTDGTSSNVEVLKGAGYGMDEEATSVIKSITNWVPGMQDGQKVKSRFTIPIKFALAENQLYLVDGKEVDKETVDKINANAIACVNVLKGEKAIKEYGNKGKYGVVMISIKKQ